jgi:hypothetical protein
MHQIHNKVISSNSRHKTKYIVINQIRGTNITSFNTIIKHMTKTSQRPNSQHQYYKLLNSTHNKT